MVFQDVRAGRARRELRVNMGEMGLMDRLGLKVTAPEVLKVSKGNQGCLYPDYQACQDSQGWTDCPDTQELKVPKVNLDMLFSVLRGSQG